jgi:hypothetical protein
MLERLWYYSNMNFNYLSFSKITNDGDDDKDKYNKEADPTVVFFFSNSLTLKIKVIAHVN